MINIYVGNLAYIVRDVDLIDYFSSYGHINKATVVTDRETGRSKGYGFVEMADRAEGENAIAALAGQPYKGRPMTVNEARPRGSGNGERVLGDGTGGTIAKENAHGRDHDENHDGYRPRPQTSGQEDAAPVLGGYSNSLLRR